MQVNCPLCWWLLCLPMHPASLSLTPCCPLHCRPSRHLQQQQQQQQQRCSAAVCAGVWCRPCDAVQPQGAHRHDAGSHAAQPGQQGGPGSSQQGAAGRGGQGSRSCACLASIVPLSRVQMTAPSNQVQPHFYVLLRQWVQLSPIARSMLHSQGSRVDPSRVSKALQVGGMCCRPVTIRSRVGDHRATGHKHKHTPSF
jgi:hypothetical protein